MQFFIVLLLQDYLLNQINIICTLTSLLATTILKNSHNSPLPFTNFWIHDIQENLTKTYKHAGI